MTAGAWRHAAGTIRAHPGSFFASFGLYSAFYGLALLPGLAGS